MDKVTYKLKLNELIDTDGLTTEQKEELKERIGEYLYDKILEDISEMRSSVDGRQWKSLSKEYRERKSEVASPIANLELTGDMLGALEYRTYRDGVEVGVFDKQEALKADNHCKFSAASLTTALPRRQFIPRKDESFRAGIVKELIELAEEIKDGFED